MKDKKQINHGVHGVHGGEGEKRLIKAESGLGLFLAGIGGVAGFLGDFESATFLLLAAYWFEILK